MISIIAAYVARFIPLPFPRKEKTGTIPTFSSCQQIVVDGDDFAYVSRKNETANTNK